jgi:DNA-directed RNA polymerase subunit M/transcription elongation factor TFIIS
MARQLIIDGMAGILKEVLPAAPGVSIATFLEGVCYNEYSKIRAPDNNRYSTITSRVMKYMESPGGQALMQDAFLKNTPAAIWKIPLMTDAEMYPEVYEPLLATIHQRQEQIVQEKFVALAKCRQCGSGKVTCEISQKKCADENVTATYKCKDCGKTWIVG